jgi:hypothetical protein
MADVIYNGFKKNIMNGLIDLDTDTIKVMLVTSAYTPDQDTHEFKSSVTNEVTGIGYTAGGATLANKTVTQDNVDNEGVFDADDVTWATSTITARGAVVYKSTGSDATSPLITYIDFTTDRVSTTGNFAITFGAEGIVNLT